MRAAASENAFPKARCATCAAGPRCERLGRTEPEYPRCFLPLRATDLRRVEELFAWCARRQAVADDPRITALLRALIDRFRRDRAAFSDILEPSVSWDSSGFHLLRFSYSFPGFRADEIGVATSLLAFCEPFGDAARRECKRLLRATSHPSVDHPLFGIAHDGASGVRVKLYLQFKRGTERGAPLEIAGRLLGRPDLRQSLPEGSALHLLGVDIGPSGLSAAKLYLVHEELGMNEIDERIGPSEITSALRETGVQRLRGVLAIHRLESPDDPRLGAPAEVDFSLPDNDLRWSDLCALPLLQRVIDPSGPLAQLTASFRIGARRVSAPVGPFKKLNLYYVLAEPEGAS